MTGNPGSTMAREADVHLNAAVDKEACPLNLAPTASTTAALALGDALAATGHPMQLIPKYVMLGLAQFLRPHRRGEPGGGAPGFRGELSANLDESALFGVLPVRRRVTHLAHVPPPAKSSRLMLRMLATRAPH